MNYVEIAIDILRLAGVGLVAGLFASYLANRDHRHRKWWERRVVAYQGVIEALSNLVYYYETHYHAEITRQEMTDRLRDQLNEIWLGAFHKVRVAADTGAFLYSEQVNNALRAFVEEGEFQTFFELLDDRLSKAKTCLDVVVSCSKSDLKLK